MGVGGLVIGALLWVLLPEEAPVARRDDWLKGATHALAVVLRNPQSILCGMIAGLLFIPTTIFDMIWGVRFLQEARGLDYATRGDPLVDGAGRLDHRLPGARPALGPDRPPQAGHRGERAGAVRLPGVHSLRRPRRVSPYVLGLVAGFASGAAMLPYTIIKEANPPQMSGTATGVVNFLNFTFSALLGPVFGWALTGVAAGAGRTLEHLPDRIRAAVVRRGPRGRADAPS